MSQAPLYSKNICGYPETWVSSAPADDGSWVKTERMPLSGEPVGYTMPATYGRALPSGTHSLKRRWDCDMPAATDEPYGTFQLSYGGYAGSAQNIEEHEA